MLEPELERLLDKLLKADQKQPVLDALNDEMERRQLASECRVHEAWEKAWYLQSYIESQ